jgi:hypothetical protein
MSARVTVAVDDGGAIAVKSATTPDEIAELAVEAERLRQARHPGVVVLLDHQRTPAGAELRTRYAGEPLDRWHGTLVRLAGLIAAVAADLGDLHDIGVVHGRIDGSHVLVGSNGRPRLCGFAPPPADAVAADDVAALARMLGEMAERTAATERRRPFLWRRGPVADQRALSQIVHRATDPVPSRRPRARNLANAILAAVPGAELPPPESTPPRVDDPGFDAVFGDQTDVTLDEVFDDRPWSSGPSGTSETTLERPAPAGRVRFGMSHANRRSVPRATLTTGLVGAAAVAVGAVLLRGGATATSAGEDVTATTLVTAALPPEVHIDGGVVELAGERWSVGQPGDIVTVGDWDCDGIATPAAYRPATGDVFVFGDWADADQPVTVEPVAQVAGGRGLGAGRNERSDGCDIPVVDLPSGDQHPVELPPADPASHEVTR